MSDAATSVTPLRGALQGLPQRLVADGLVAEQAMIDAISAARERRAHIVSYLVEYNLADAREIAIAASQEFGAPLLDLDAVQPDFETVRLVSEKTLRKHRVLPLVKRGKRLFVGVSDPTNLHALDEVKFATGLSVEPSSSRRTSSRSCSPGRSSRSTPPCPSWRATTSNSDSLEVTADDEGADEGVERADVEDAPIVRFVNKVLLDAIKRSASDIPLRAL